MRACTSTPQSSFQRKNNCNYVRLCQRSARSSHRPRNDRGMSKNSSPRSCLDLGLSLILVSSLVSVSKKVKNPRNSSFFPRNDRGMRKKSSPRSRLDLGLGQANSLELDLGLEKGALADLWYNWLSSELVSSVVRGGPGLVRRAPGN